MVMMAHLITSITITIFLISSLIISSSSTAKAQVISLPINKDDATLQFYTTVRLGSPSAAFATVLDIGGQNLWINCDIYNSSTFRPLRCSTAQCNAIGDGSCVGCNGPFRPGCTNDTCGTTSSNPFAEILLSSGILQDQLRIGSGNIRTFPFGCSAPDYMTGLSAKAQGIFGLGSGPMAPPRQIASSFKIPKSFAVCLPSTSFGAAGTLLFGDVNSTKYASVIKSLFKTTPLVDFPVANVLPAQEYYIGVTSIKVAGVAVEFDADLLAITSNGVGGTKISTVTNYTVLHTNIYKPLVRAFQKAASDKKMKKVASAGGFDTCYSASSVVTTYMGLDVPTIDLVLQSNEVHWRIFGQNSMVKVNEDTLCLGFVDGGKRKGQSFVASVLLGVHQLQDNLLEFNLNDKTLSFSSLLRKGNRNRRRIVPQASLSPSILLIVALLQWHQQAHMNKNKISIQNNSTLQL